MIGAAGISAFPMSARVIQKMAMEEDPENVILMHAAGANVSGQIASVVAGGTADPACIWISVNRIAASGKVE